LVNDTTQQTTDFWHFCPRQLVTDFLRGSYRETGIMDFGLKHEHETDKYDGSVGNNSDENTLKQSLSVIARHNELGNLTA